VSSDGGGAGSPAMVWDAVGRPVQLGRRLRVDEQSELWEAADGSTAVVVLRSRASSDAVRLDARLSVIRRLDLSGLPLSRLGVPLRRPYVGYTTDMTAGLVPVGHLASPAGANLTAWYASTGGLGWRLRLLARVAAALALLNSRGVVYGNPSHDNILVPDAPPTSVPSAPSGGELPVPDEVWLTDVHNVTVEAEVRQAAEVTAGCAAPEVFTGRLGVSSLSDAFAFAVLAFHTLTAVHPFLGDAVYDGELALRDEAFAGRLPWIDDAADDRNRCRYGVPRAWVVSPALHVMFERTFVAGRWEPASRSTVAEWSAELFRAAEAILACELCRNTFYGDLPACPWCGDAAPPALVGQVHTDLRDDRGEPIARVGQPGAVMIQRDVTTLVAARLTTFDSGDPERPVAALLHARGGGLAVRNLWGRPLWTVSPDGLSHVVVEPDAESMVPVTGGRLWTLHFGPPTVSHRLIEFVPVRRAAAL
jgi:eukaryotic-like serine/threonine-protein kinase